MLRILICNQLTTNKRSRMGNRNFDRLGSRPRIFKFWKSFHWNTYRLYLPTVIYFKQELLWYKFWFFFLFWIWRSFCGYRSTFFFCKQLFRLFWLLITKIDRTVTIPTTGYITKNVSYRCYFPFRRYSAKRSSFRMEGMFWEVSIL